MRLLNVKTCSVLGDDTVSTVALFLIATRVLTVEGLSGAGGTATVTAKFSEPATEPKLSLDGHTR
jgi:hypothetical protein